MNKKYKYNKFIFVIKKNKTLRQRKKIFKKWLKWFNKINITFDESLILWYKLAPIIAWIVMFKILKKSFAKYLTN
jgi:hypothetical protein